MRAAQLREYCLAFPGTEETFPFSPGTSVFKVPDQMILDMVEDSYDLVVSQLPRATRRRLGWRGE